MPDFTNTFQDVQNDDLFPNFEGFLPEEEVVSEYLRINAEIEEKEQEQQDLEKEASNLPFFEYDLNSDFKDKEEIIDDLRYQLNAQKEKVIELFSEAAKRMNKPIKIGSYQISLNGSELVVEQF